LTRRVGASEWRQFRGLESLVHTSSRGIQTQTSSCKSGKTVQDIEGVDCELLLVASRPSPPAVIHASCLPGTWVKLFLWQHCVLLAVVANQENRRESVRE